MRSMLRVVVALALMAGFPRAALADAGCDPAACGGFACVDGGCGTTCNVDGDCASGFKCDTAHDKCVVPDPDSVGQNDSSSFCAYGHATTPPLLLGVLLLGFLRRR